jgi:hypothetical protein
MGKVIVRTGRLVAAASAALTLAGASAGRGLARTRTANMMLVAAALAAGLTVTACQPASAPVGQSGPGAAAPAGQAGEDPGCAALASQMPAINSQLSAASGSTSAELAVDETWYSDLQADEQEAQSGVVAGAFGDAAAGLEDVILDQENLLDDPNIGFSQLDSDDSAFQSDVSNLETQCGFSS